MTGICVDLTIILCLHPVAYLAAAYNRQNMATQYVCHATLSWGNILHTKN